uniref:Uncharacterized protein n=1 Tax=Arion vulgaris TaxID=1028688 RepID=A0A0B7AHE0_9EUPU
MTNLMTFKMTTIIITNDILYDKCYHINTILKLICITSYEPGMDTEQEKHTYAL